MGTEQDTYVTNPQLLGGERKYYKVKQKAPLSSSEVGVVTNAEKTKKYLSRQRNA
jgi:hypothetical protein